MKKPKGNPDVTTVAAEGSWFRDAAVVLRRPLEVDKDFARRTMQRTLQVLKTKTDKRPDPHG